jgi:hypothetical protein
MIEGRVYTSAGRWYGKGTTFRICYSHHEYGLKDNIVDGATKSNLDPTIWPQHYHSMTSFPPANSRTCKMFCPIKGRILLAGMVASEPFSLIEGGSAIRLPDVEAVGDSQTVHLVTV